MKKKPQLKVVPKQHKNSMVFTLLSYVPEFKKDVSNLRIELGIKAEGFDWGSTELYDWASKNDIWYYEGAVGESDEDRVSANDDSVIDEFPSNFFEEKMLEIGDKYKLPFALYAFPYRGLARYVLSGEIETHDHNYAIKFRGGDKLLWTSIVALAPLSKAEAKKALSILLETQTDTIPFFFKGLEIFGTKRTRSNFERDLRLLEEQVGRSGKPKKIKTYEQGSYLDILSKSKTKNPQSMKSMERIHKNSIIADYNNPTSAQIGTRQGVSGDATRQAKKRLNSLAQELFGYDLES